MTRPPTAPDLGTGARAYLRLLRHGPAGWPFLAALIARLPMSMAPLGILLLVQHERDSYSIAGFVTGAFAVGSAAGTPIWGRLMDRFGQTRVLLPTSLTSAAFLVLLALATIGGGSTGWLVALAAGAGLCYPPVGPAIRAAWRVIFADQRSRRVAFALDGTSVELIFVGGPLLLSVMLALTPPVVPLLVTAGLMAGGGVAYCRTWAARQSRPRPARSGDESLTALADTSPRTALAASGVAALLMVMLGLSVGFGLLDTSMAATAGQLLGGTNNVGLLFAAIAGGSTVGGLVYGARSWPFDERQAVPALLGMFALLLGVMALLIQAPPSATMWLVFPLLFVTGVTIAPTLIMQQSLLDHLAPSDRLNEAQAFLSASNTTGAAAGTAIAGLLIDFQGLAWSYGGAAVAAALAAGIAAASRGHWRTAMEAHGGGPDREAAPEPGAEPSVMDATERR